MCPQTWIITDGKAGMEVQCIGVAEKLGLTYAIKRVSPTWPWRILAPWGPVAPSERFAQTGNVFAPPFPDLAIATGRQSIPYLRALRKHAGRRTFTVVIQDPRTGIGTADLICVPAHDSLEGENVIKTLTAPHPFSQERLANLRMAMPHDIALLPRPRVAILLGGSNAVYRFTQSTTMRLIAAVQSLAGLGASFLIASSRRTSKTLIAALNRAITAPHIIWNGEEPNPYALFLAHADLLIVTADSINMTSEACSTGRPVYVFEPEGGSAKFAKFHANLRRFGATRRLPESFAQLESWNYAAVDSTATIAGEIERRRLACKNSQA
jgi:uncharacterized protein